jgi:prophage antirepressor-like protein
MSNNEKYPERAVRYNGISVTLYEIDGREYITSEDIGRCLGLADPRRSVHRILSRNQEELEPHKGVVKLTTPGGPQEITVFTETGANLIAMFSRTPEAKDFRLWLAKLPKQHRQIKEYLPEIVERIRREERQEGAARALILLERGSAQHLGIYGLKRLIWYRIQGLTQNETAELMNISLAGVQEMERPLKDMGIVFKATNDARRKRAVRLALAEALADAPSETKLGPGDNSEMPKLPAPEPDA